jgi:hypothetical protein
MANIKSAIKRAELNIIQNERNSAQKLLCALQSKNLKLPLLLALMMRKHCMSLHLLQSTKLILCYLIHKIKLTVINHV